MLKAYLEITSSAKSGPKEGFMELNKAISFQSDSVFGREDVDYAIDDDYVSRTHFQIALMGDEAYLTDLSSRHGTFLNGEKIARSMRLNSGDTIRVGKTTMAFRLELAPKNSEAHANLASLDQPAIVSIGEEANYKVHAQVSPDNALQDRPTDIDMGDEPAAVVAKDENLLVSKSDTPVFPNEDLPMPYVIPDEDAMGYGPADVGSADEGPVCLDLEELESMAAQPVVASKPTPVVKEAPKPTTIPSEKLTGEINLDADLARELGGWQQFPSGWYEYAWGPPKSSHSLCDALDEVSQMVSLWAVVHFGKLGSSTPWSLSDCQPIWNGVPEPLAKTYGPVVVHYNILRKAVKPEVISKLWNSRTLLLIGGENAAVMQQGFRERLWLRSEGSTTTFQEHPLDSSVFWRLWTRQESSALHDSQPLWAPHISVVLMAGSDAKTIQVLARKRLNLRSIN